MGEQTAYQDQTLTCCDCGEDFEFNAGEQQFFADKQLSPPRRCKECRCKRRDGSRNIGSRDAGPREVGTADRQSPPRQDHRAQGDSEQGQKTGPSDDPKHDRRKRHNRRKEHSGRDERRRDDFWQ